MQSLAIRRRCITLSRIMTKKLTLSDIAKMAGVTSATVSRALNPATAHLISQETAQRIQELCDRLGYRPSISARGIATGRTYKVGMILQEMQKDLTSHDWNRITCEISTELQAMGYSLIILRTSEKDTPMDAQVSRFLMSGVADAYISSPSMVANNSQEILNVLKAPLAVICESQVFSPANAGVLRSNKKAFQEIWKRIPKESYGRIAFFSPDSVDQRRMFNEFCEVGWTQGINAAQAIQYVPFQRESLSPVLEYAEAYHQAKQQMTVLNNYDIIWCPSDFFALGVKDALTETGRIPGKDVKLLGYGDLETFPGVSKSPVLSTVSANTSLIAKEICKLLVQMLNGEAPRYATVEASFISRETF